ncbi:alpha-L-fucosidase [Pedobacter nutrimenti]|uniref:alpha-L-fucosidase n=1 Tax=Pedobacter nutrimenti TaxID=1241337 RepID=UPI00292FFF5E|nr:alpha-L-fucosidase [Pedobacter nutrimenti]
MRVYNIRSLVFFSILISLVSFRAEAQWSVLENDPRPHNYLYQRFTPAEWKASNFAKPEDMKWFADARYGMFITFGLSAYVNKDLSWPVVYTRKAPDSGHGAYPDSVWTKWPSLFKLEKFNADEWVKIAQDAGMKYIVVIAKHHDGFHMWDTQYSDFKITNTPFGRDYIKELADACHKAGMRFGIYYSQRDWHHPDYAPIDPATIKTMDDAPYFEAAPGKKVAQGASHKKYIAYQFNVVKELCTKYGKVDIFWFDALYWGGMFKADMWDAENLTRMIRKLQPGIVINNRASLPGDFDTPEQRVGMYQSRPWESCMTMNGSWAYSPAPVKTVKVLLREMLSTAAGNGNTLLSWGAHWDGEFDLKQKDTLLRIGAWLKKYGYTYYGTHGGPWMPDNEWGGSTYKGNKIYLYVYNWKAKGLTLPVLPGNSVLKAEFINLKEKLSWRKAGHNLNFVRPVAPDSIVTVIRLTMRKPVTGVLDAIDKSVFADPAYGTKIKDGYVKVNNQIDLGKTVNVTGIGVKQNKGRISINISADGKEWEPLETLAAKDKEISLTTFIAGARVLGRQVRYLKLNSVQALPDLKIEIYAK